MRKQTNDDSAWYENNNHQVMKVEKVNPQEGLFSRDFLDNFLLGYNCYKMQQLQKTKYYCNIICY